MQEDNDFLLVQQEKGRKGLMAGENKKLAATENNPCEEDVGSIAFRTPKRKRGQKTVVTSELAVVLN